jgi:hypothetical protein
MLTNNNESLEKTNLITITNFISLINLDDNEDIIWTDRIFKFIGFYDYICDENCLWES